MKSFLESLFLGKHVCIVGFGLEGKSTYNFIRKHLPNFNLTLIDKNNIFINNNSLINDDFVNILFGDNYLDYLKEFDIILKSPGIPSNTLPNDLDLTKVTSQTDIFLKMFGNQVIGITGTKGKSTTSSLTYHILKSAGLSAILVGNIGIPPFDIADEIQPETVIVMEMSSHQLEFVSAAPHISVLLNLFQEHLDHYHSYEHYKSAKFNIALYQNSSDYFICNIGNNEIADYLNSHDGFKSQILTFSLFKSQKSCISKVGDFIEFDINNSKINLYNTQSDRQLAGEHNLNNIIAAAAACFLKGVTPNTIEKAVASFNGLEHRIELVGEYAGIIWYNDSIATIPEAAIEAVKTLKNVDTLILGGYDKRNIDFTKLYSFLSTAEIKNIIFIGQAGQRMQKEFENQNTQKINLYYALDYKQVVDLAANHTRKGKICLLSPSASSYDMFKNFEERGKVFKQYIMQLK